jgi:hypothetical protein
LPGIRKQQCTEFTGTLFAGICAVMWALVALNDYAKGLGARVILVRETEQEIFNWFRTRTPYWWANGEETEAPKKLTWRTDVSDSDSYSECYCAGKILGKPVTRLQIRRVEIG